MRVSLVTLAPILHLTRITTAFAAIGNVWFVILWTRASSPHERGIPGSLVSDGPLWSALVFGGVTALGLFAFAMSLNDTLDVRRDRALHPGRPIPSGQMGVDQAVWLVAGALVVAMLGAAGLGISAVWVCGLTAGAIVGYHIVWRFLPSFGLVVLGSIYAMHMLIPNYRLEFMWPVWLVMTHALCVWAVAHHVGMKRPALTPSIIFGAVGGWAAGSAVLLGVGWWRSGSIWPAWVDPRAAIAPVLLAIAFGLFLRSKIRAGRGAQRTSEKVQRYGAFWLTLYSTAWLLGQGHFRAAILLGGLALAGLFGMTVLRELYSLLEQPVGYRR